MASKIKLRNDTKLRQNSKKGKERILSPRGAENTKYPEKVKIENNRGPRYVDQHSEQGLQAVSLKTLGDHQKQFLDGKVTKGDELIKHMACLPDYLQDIEKQENLQEKALNVGVLDWGRLEKWKLTQKYELKKGRFNVSVSCSDKSLNGTKRISSLPDEACTKVLVGRSGPLISRSYGLGSSSKTSLDQCAKPATQKVMRNQETNRVTGCSLDEEKTKKVPFMYRSLGRNHYNIMLHSGRSKEGQKIALGVSSSSTLKHCRKSHSLKANSNGCDAKVVKKVAESPQSNAKEKILSSAESGEPLTETKEEINKTVEALSESDKHIDPVDCRGKHKNIVLLLPKRPPQSNLRGISNKFKVGAVQSQGSKEISQNNLSDSFPFEDLPSTEQYPEIPHSCPLPCHDEVPWETTNQSVKSSLSFPSIQKLPNTPSEGKSTKNQSSIALMEQSFAENLEILDQEAAEMEAKKSVSSSPNRRFSFSLGRMRRSFSFKETTSLPQLSSAYVFSKSGPVGGKDSTCLDVSSSEKADIPTRDRSSPLRRLLDPLLKPRSINSHSWVENITPLNRKLSISSNTLNADMPLIIEQNKGSTVEALLQVTITDGSPLFKFAVDNNNNILAATMKDSMPSGKDDSVCSYTFYSVNEAKKRAGWMGQGSKVKGGDFVCNVVGQMQVSNKSFSHLAAEDFNDHEITTECVLSGVRQANTESPDFLPNRELAAIVCKISTNHFSHDGEQTNCHKNWINSNLVDSSAGNYCNCKFMKQDQEPCSVTVILPGAVHGLPNKGEPSPLINRWRSGGSCDCGGWDIGCKMRVLSSLNGFCRTPKLETCLISNCIELFVQGEAQCKKHIFRLAPFREGIYSIEFHSSISLLQAFSICVAVISCQTSGPSKCKLLPAIRTVKEPAFNGNSAMKNPTIAPAKYAPYPPLSPVGRV